MSAELACPTCGARTVDGGWCASCQRSAHVAACACGTPLTRDGWCARCQLVRAVASNPQRPAVPTAVTGRSGRRWDRTTLTFGPLGRVGATVAVLVAPFLLLGISGATITPDLSGTIGPVYGWAFGLLWWTTVTPWALRDIWRDGRRRHRL